MDARINLRDADPGAEKAIYALEKYVDQTDIPPLHLHLIKIRASQINGCAFCIKMHTRDARKLGETEERIYLLDAWKEVKGLYSNEERIILALTEEITLISEHGLTEETYQQAIKQFGPVKLSQLITAVIAINSWNRICISLQIQPEIKLPESSVKKNAGLVGELS